MSDSRCPFSTVQAAGLCRCRLAQEVIRRGGSEYDCTDPAAHAACVALVSHLNAVALPALGHADDLTLTPRSVYDRILAGGLSGLRQGLDPADTALETEDIRAVVEAVLALYPEVTAIPAGEFVPAIERCSLRKRRRGR